MKNIYILIFLVISGFGYAQVTELTGNANYVLEANLSIGKAHSGGYCGTGGLNWLNLLKKNGPPKYLKPDDGSEWESLSNTFASVEFDESNPITHFSLYSRFRHSVVWSCKNESERTTKIVINRSENITHNNVYSSGISGSITMNTYPVINLINPGSSTFIGTNSSLKIPTISGVDKKYFNWMFHIDGEQQRIKVFGTFFYIDVWRSLPIEYQQKNSLNIARCSDIFPIEALGKKIVLRANTKGDTVELRYVISAPSGTVIAVNQPTCYDEEDGSVKIKFDRTLNNGEQLAYSLVKIIGVNGTPSASRELNIARDSTFTIDSLSLGKYKLQLLGFSNGFNTVAQLDLVTFDIIPPPPVGFQLSSTDVNCYGGTDGKITITASGGTGKGYQYSIDGGTWTPFKDPQKLTETITGLHPLLPTDLAVTYTIRVKDEKGCIAKIQKIVKGKIELQEELSSPITITQPLKALVLANEKPFVKAATFFGGENALVTASFTGGTLINGNSYTYTWTNTNYSTAVLASKTVAQYNNGIYSLTLSNVKAGEYNLTLQDANGCSINPVSEPKLKIVVGQPDAPLRIVLEVTQPISCNTESLGIIENAGKESDAIINATVTGGVPFVSPANNGLPYQYIWSKYNTVTQVWDIVVNQKKDQLTGLARGNYALNVLDANGIMQGTYGTTDLVTASPATQEIAEPLALVLGFNSGNVSCHGGNNAWAIANVTGGTGAYSYKWYNTEQGIVDGNKIFQLVVGTYTVAVTDAKGCFKKDDIVISEPTSAVAIDYEEIFTPTFSGGSNGRIVAKVTGGTPKADKSYSYEWRNSKGVLQSVTAAMVNGIYTLTLNNVPAEDYFLTIKDENYNEAGNQIANCSVLQSKVALNDPKPLAVTFEIVRPISCNTLNEFGNAKDTDPSDGQRDESQDGILIAHVTGGTPLASTVNKGLPYFYNWKKQQTDGSWIDLTTRKDSVASNLSHGNYALNVRDRNNVILGSYSNGNWIAKDSIQLMQEPLKLYVEVTKGNVFCNGGNDGWATAKVFGGTAPYTYTWSNGVTVAENTVLKAGQYLISITDARGCTTQQSVKITEPLEPIAIKYTEVVDPSFYKATNGKIVVEVTGGTIFTNNTYWYEWKNSKGSIQTATTAQFNNGVYTITLNGVPEDVYSLSVRDANYTAATNKLGCTVANATTTLDDPDPLQVTFEVVRTISCNATNEFGNETDTTPKDSQRDESQDGIIIAHVVGGITLAAEKNNGLPYYYTWKKQQKDGSWIIWNDKDETAEYISNGNYALNIEDANGIKLGTYLNNALVKEIDVTQNMPEPAKLTLSFKKFDVGCTTGDDGWAEAYVSGGTPPYTYQWSNGAETSKIENITTNNYFVVINDANGCAVQGSIFVGDPNGIFTVETIKNPTCAKDKNGAIELNVSGGNLPYRYLWNTGATTKDLNNVAAGSYEVAISCPDCCVYKKKFTLKDPEPVMVNIGLDRTLCIDQNLDLDATIADPNAQYSWSSTNGFTSSEAKVNVSKAGTYRIKVTSGLGCIGEDEIVIKTSRALISSEFLLSSQAYLDEEVILVNTSNPFGENTNWVIPKGVQIVEQKEKYITLKFDAVGVYEIGLQQTQGECYAIFNKSIAVEQRSSMPNTNSDSKFIVDFIVTPSPSDGNFKALVNLENTSAINLRLFSSTGQYSMLQKKGAGNKKYEVDFNTALGAGVYFIVLETEQQTVVKKIIIY